jgi:RNA polymerase sporulation-specific sigma factor
MELKKAQGGDKAALDRIVEENINLVRSIIGRFTVLGYERDDLFQIGCIGLIKAVQRFDVNFAVRFSTYAVPVIIGEVKRFIRDDNVIKVSRDLKSLGVKAKKMMSELYGELGREPTLKEVASRLGVAPEEAAAAMEAARPLKSLYEPLKGKEGDELFLIDNIAASSAAVREIDRLALHEGLEKLTETERKVVRLRFFADKTQSEAAKEMLVSQVQVSRLERRALKKLKDFL